MLRTATAWAALWSESWGLDDPEGPPSQSGKAAPAAAEVGVGHHPTPAPESGRRGVPAAPPIGAVAAARSPRRRRTEGGFCPPPWVGGGGAEFRRRRQGWGHLLPPPVRAKAATRLLHQIHDRGGAAMFCAFFG